MVHLITYELVGLRMPTETHKLETAIKALGDAYAFDKTVWVVECELDNREICSRLASYLRPSDRIIVTRIYRDWITANVPQAEVDWMASRNYTSATDAVGPARVVPPPFTR